MAGCACRDEAGVLAKASSIERPPDLHNGLGFSQRAAGGFFEAVEALADGVRVDVEVLCGDVDVAVVA